MFICNCNPFSDQKAEAYLETRRGEIVTMREIYKNCANGANPKCGIACVPRLRDMTRKHNRAVHDGAVFIDPVEEYVLEVA